jgi:hypothetical protein
MSLMRLLSAGKTLVGSGEPSGRYRINTGYHLPKFGSTKNPFKKPEQEKPAEEKPAAQVEMQMPSPIQKEEEKVRLSSAELAAVELKETQPVSVAVPAVPPLEIVVPVATPATPAQEKVHPILAMLDWMDDTAVRVKERVVKMELKKLIPKRKSVFASPTVVKPQAGPVQPELSLEKVRVVRNDLSDSDLELVAVKTEVKTETKAEVIAKSRVVRPADDKTEVNRMDVAPELIGVAE